jgi:hypothetical protein
MTLLNPPPTFQVGDAVRIQRDEIKNPPKGTWASFRGRPGFVCIVNDTDDPPEYGVILTTTRPQWRKNEGHENELSYDSEAIRWFTPYELAPRREV